MKMNEEDPVKRPLLFATELSAATKLKGILRFTEPLCIKGEFEGSIYGGSFLSIDRTAKVIATIEKTGSLSVAGGFSGSAKTDRSIELLPGSIVNATLVTQSLAMGNKAKFSGMIAMKGMESEWTPWEMNNEPLLRKNEDVN
jgi:cytoskeletal protein CcmA (bactofilin family)